MARNDRPTGSVGAVGWLQERIDEDEEGQRVEEVDIRQGTYAVRQVMLSWSDVDN
jgi:hypothetical protein